MPRLALDDPDDVVAHHEAGHAVTSYRLRGFVGTVTIEPNARHAGGTEVWVLSPPLVDQGGKVVEKPQYTPDEIKCFEDATMIAIAGPVSETLYWPHRDYDAVVAANSDDEGKIVTITKKIWGASARDMEITLRDRVRTLLNKHWQDVQRLAKALEASRTLHRTAVVRLIEGGSATSSSSPKATRPSSA